MTNRKQQTADKFWNRVKELSSDKKIRQLDEDIALMKVVREKALERIDLEALNATDAAELMQLTDAISRLAQRASAIDAAAQLSVPEINLLMAELWIVIKSMPTEYAIKTIEVLKATAMLKRAVPADDDTAIVTAN